MVKTSLFHSDNMGSNPIRDNDKIKFLWDIAKWEGTRFWYEHSKVQILLSQKIKI